MNILVDHNLIGHALLLSGSILSDGWLDWIVIRFIAFYEIGLSINSDDRVVWQLAQLNKMILLTANRSMKGENSIEIRFFPKNGFYFLSFSQLWDRKRNRVSIIYCYLG